MNELSLFSGAGGGLLATKWLLRWKTIGYVEIEEYPRKVLKARIDDGLLDPAPIFTDIRKFISEGYAESYSGMVDVVSGGFPCQPFSVAGKRKAADDERNMWPATADVIRIVRPRSVLLENVPGVRKYLPVVVRDLRRLGYTVRRPSIVAAASVGAGHIRRRVWIYAHADEARRPYTPGESAAEARGEIRGAVGLEDCKEVPANAHQVWQLQQEGTNENQRERPSHCDWWKAEPGVVRVVYGLSDGMDRIGALGNGQVPAVVELAWKILSGEQ